MEIQQQKQLLRFSREVLENELYDSQHNYKSYEIPEYLQKRGLFVTLQKRGSLRGCIGRLEAKDTIFNNLIDLTKAAAFQDHRFDKLTARELDHVQIEISLLSKPKEIDGLTTYEKMLKIRPKKDGVIISSNGHNATFLPQVWESIPILENFVSELCRKAGLSKNYWQQNLLKISVYQVEHFQEA